MRFEKVSFAYGDKWIMHDFDLILPDTGLCALTGPSGCGKTTLLRLAAGLERPTSGRITDASPGQTAVLFQENRLLPRLNAADQLRAVLPKGTDPLPWLRLVGLEGDAGQPMSALSGGMRRRVALARCLAYGVGKKLLIMDEPFTGVDPETAGQIIDGVRAMGVPVLLSAHDAESLALADTVVRLQGPPLSVGTEEDMMRFP